MPGMAHATEVGDWAHPESGTACAEALLSLIG
jgi:hypothetical protein